MRKAYEEVSINEDIKLETLEITNPDTVGIIFHKQRQKILRLLIEKEMTIIELSQVVYSNDNKKLNPGTVKRYLKDLEKYDLITLSRIVKNKFGINMKYYRAIAKKFNVNISFP